MDIVKTLLYMKPDIKFMVWENDIDRIIYNDTEEFRPTKQQILAVDQELVERHWKEREAEENNISLDDIQNQINLLLNQIQNLKDNNYEKISN